MKPRQRQHLAFITVSILVVMDLALQPPLRLTVTKNRHCFNPCCNGFSVATTQKEISSMWVYEVSILVVMDLALQQAPEEKDEDVGFDVSILVVMDLALQRSAAHLRRT